MMAKYFRIATEFKYLEIYLKFKINAIFILIQGDNNTQLGEPLFSHNDIKIQPLARAASPAAFPFICLVAVSKPTVL
jgi:hypothetical protein